MVDVCFFFLVGATWRNCGVCVYYGGCTMEGVLWRVYYGGCTMEGVLWRVYYGGCTMEGVLWRGCTMEGVLWRGYYGGDGGCTMEDMCL
jgi:hypothetical protein